MKKVFLFLSCLALLSCSEDNFAKYSSLDRLRVLALIVDKPEIQNPSAGVTNVMLSPYISDIGGTGSVTLEIQSCLDPGTNLGARPSCEGASQASSVQTVTVSDPSGQATGVFGSPERTGRPSSGAITVGLQIPENLMSKYSSAIQYNGISYLITVKATRGSDIVRSFRRVLISNKTPNTNPVLSDILANGSALTTLPLGSSVALSFSASTTPEDYQFLNNSGEYSSLTEVYETTWFVSDGEMQNPRSDSDQTMTWKTPTAAPSNRQSIIVGVLRDGRGGLSILIKKL